MKISLGLPFFMRDLLDIVRGLDTLQDGLDEWERVKGGLSAAASSQMLMHMGSVTALIQLC